MRKRLAAGALAGAMVLGVPGPAAAAPAGLEKKQDEHFLLSCPGLGDVQVVSGGGRSAWLNDERYHAVRFNVTFTFTPPGGLPETEVFDKTFGRGPKGEVITCDVDVTLSDPEEGTFTAVGTVSLVARHDGRR